MSVGETYLRTPSAPDDELWSRFAPVFESVAEANVEREKGREFAHQQVRWLKNAGFGTVRISKVDGGFGASLQQTFALLADLGAADPNVAHVFRNHLAFVQDRLNAPRSATNDTWIKRFLSSAAIPGLTVLSWPAVISRGLAEQVRILQYDTFLEHFGNMSKSAEAFDHHIHSRAFTTDFSNAAVDDSGVVLGYVLGSTFTAGAAPDDKRSAHTDYIGVRSDQRKRGIGELLLRKIWLAALRRGFTVGSLGTDIDNRSKAHLLYRRLGYVSVQSQYAYRIDAARGSERS